MFCLLKSYFLVVVNCVKDKTEWNYLLQMLNFCFIFIESWTFFKSERFHWHVFIYLQLKAFLIGNSLSSISMASSSKHYKSASLHLPCWLQMLDSRRHSLRSRHMVCYLAPWPIYINERFSTAVIIFNLHTLLYLRSEYRAP